MVHYINGRKVTDGEWNLIYCTNKVTLRAACKGEGLPVSGDNRKLAWRLIDAGITHEHVITHYGWRARLQPDPQIQEAFDRSPDLQEIVDRRWPNGNMPPSCAPVDEPDSCVPAEQTPNADYRRDAP